MSIARDALRDGLQFLKSHPLFLVQAARNAARLEISIPLDLVRWFVERRPAGKGPERIDVAAAPPAVGVGVTLDLYGTKIDVSTNVAVEAVDNLVDGLRISLRVRDLQVKAPPGSPAAMMVGALDLKRPASLLKMMPLPLPALVEARDDLFVLDLLKVPKLGNNPTVRKLVAALADVARVRDVRTEDDLLIIGLALNPLALPQALLKLRRRD